MSLPVRIATGALVALTLLIVTLLIGGNDKPYEVTLDLDNASGLREGSSVRTGGIEVGVVGKLSVQGGRVRVRLDIDSSEGPVGRGATAAIGSVNLLGQKFVALRRGDIHRPLASGAMLPQAKVTVGTDLDQVLRVLEPNTRAALQLLINEAGATFIGRKQDFATLLNDVPHTLTDITALVERVDSDNGSLGRLVEHTDSFLAAITPERRTLSRLIDNLGDSASVIATRRTQLRSTVAAAPGALITLQGFLGDLERTTTPLKPAVRDLAAVAPALRQTLTELSPFERAAAPALDQAKLIAPKLTSLASGVTPVLRRATPTATALADFSTSLAPASAVLDKSVDNIAAIFDNWVNAIQFRDSLSHIFRAQAAITPNVVESAISRIQNVQPDETPRSPQRKQAGSSAKKPPAPAPTTQPDEPKPTKADSSHRIPEIVETATNTVKDIVSNLLGPKRDGASPPSATPPATPAGASSLLDFLLGP